MKNLNLALLIFVTPILTIPYTASAYWWNPSTWFQTKLSDNQELMQRITDLENQVSQYKQKPASTTDVSSYQVDNSQAADLSMSEISSLISENNILKSGLANIKIQLSSLQKKYDSCQANLSESQNLNSQTQVQGARIDSSVARNAQKSGFPFQDSKIEDVPFHYDTYIKAIVADLVKNPSAYQDWGTEILFAKISAFIPVGDRGVTKNYVEITDNSGEHKMMVEIGDSNEYNSMTYSLHVGDMIDVWGIAKPIQQFNPAPNSTNNNPVYEPVIFAQMVAACSVSGTKSCDGTGVNPVFSRSAD